jgi:hypothetical protein
LNARAFKLYHPVFRAVRRSTPTNDANFAASRAGFQMDETSIDSSAWLGVSKSSFSRRPPEQCTFLNFGDLADILQFAAIP